MSESTSLRSMNLEKYNTIILAGGSFREWSDNEVQKLKTWAAKGGNIVAYKSSAEWAAKNGFGKTKFKTTVKADTTIYLKYAERNKERSLNYISGAIFNTKIDITHPLCYGYTDENLAVFKSGAGVVQPLNIKYAEPVKFTADPYISGWVSEKNIERIKNAPVVSVQSLGSGKLISYHDNMNFRGIWLGTSKLFSNSVFFGSVIR